MSSTDDSLIILDSVDSTNNYAMGLIHSGMARPGLAVMSYEQVAGKGRQGKVWETQKGQNLTITFIEDLSHVPLYRQFEISMAGSLAVVDLFIEMGAPEVKIKWPNDIYYNDKKAGGILIENVISGQTIKWTLTGIGVNINQTTFPTDIKATSLKLINGIENEVLEVAKLLKKCISERFLQLKKQQNDDWLSIYNDRLYAAGRVMKLKKGSAVFETTIIGVNQAGALITKDSIERNFVFDEIQWILE